MTDRTPLAAVSPRFRPREARRLAVTAAVAAASLGAPVSAQSVGDVFRRVSDAVVIVRTSSTQYPLMRRDRPMSVGGTGSGVLISPTEVMTAAHVVQTADEVQLEFPTGEVVRALVTSSRTTHDVALLQITEPVSVQPVPIGDSDTVEVGDQVFVVGAPFGQSHTLTVGHVSARRRPTGRLGGDAAVEYLQTDAAINPGNSGGPMFNMDGEVIGIVSHILTLSGGFQGLGYAVSANAARQVLLEEPGIWTGVEGLPVTGVLAALLNVPPPGGGLLVQGVAAGSPAAALGIQPSTVPVEIAGESLQIGGDIILAVQGIQLGAELEGWDRIQRAISGLPRGSAVTVTVLRAGQVMQLSGVLPS
jgi:serine protease Do